MYTTEPIIIMTVPPLPHRQAPMLSYTQDKVLLENRSVGHRSEF